MSNALHEPKTERVYPPSGYGFVELDSTYYHLLNKVEVNKLKYEIVTTVKLPCGIEYTGMNGTDKFYYESVIDEGNICSNCMLEVSRVQSACLKKD